MSDTNTTGGYIQSELEEYLAASRKLNADKAYIGEMLMLLSAFGGNEFRQRTFMLGHINLAMPVLAHCDPLDLGIELRRGMSGLRLVVWDERSREVHVLEVGKSGQYATQGIPAWLVAPLREAIPMIFDIVQNEYRGLRTFLDDLRHYAG
jgi:hypothetical protein